MQEACDARAGDVAWEISYVATGSEQEADAGFDNSC